jgi:hypothetical protein
MAANCAEATLARACRSRCEHRQNYRCENSKACQVKSRVRVPHADGVAIGIHRSCGYFNANAATLNALAPFRGANLWVATICRWSMK